MRTLNAVAGALAQMVVLDDNPKLKTALPTTYVDRGAGKRLANLRDRGEAMSASASQSHAEAGRERCYPQLRLWRNSTNQETGGTSMARKGYGSGFNLDMTEINENRRIEREQHQAEYGAPTPSRRASKAKSALDQIELLKEQQEIDKLTDIGG